MANKRQRIRKAKAKREATIALNLSHALPDTLPTTTIRTNSKQLARLAERWGTGRPDFVQPMRGPNKDKPNSDTMPRGLLPDHVKTYKRHSKDMNMQEQTALNKFKADARAANFRRQIEKSKKNLGL